MTSDELMPCPFCGGEAILQMSYIEAEREVDRLQTENAKLREQMDRLVTLLRVDCDIDASWDGLRRFWSIGLTEDGCLMRDRACKAEAENAKLRELAVLNWEWAHSCCGNNCKMRTDGCGYQIDRECNYEREIYDRMRELGIELNDCE